MFADSQFEMARFPVLLGNFSHYFFGITLSIVAIFLILLVLVQRGRGGGLAGAFGGMGGQSAFGTKAGDTFTKVTIGVSLFWILLCIAAVKMLGNPSGSFGHATSPDQPQFVPGATGDSPPALPNADFDPTNPGDSSSGATPPSGSSGAESTPTGSATPPTAPTPTQTPNPTE